MDVRIEMALPGDSDCLTQIAFAGKRHWNYPESYLKLWKDELTITSEYIEQNRVFKALVDGEIVGFYSLVYVAEEFYSGEVLVSKGWWLDHLFILPQFHHQKIGTKLMASAFSELKKCGAESCQVFVDPFARGFYEKAGAHFLYESPSSIPGRMLPVFNLPIK